MDQDMGRRLDLVRTSAPREGSKSMRRSDFVSLSFSRSPRRPPHTSMQRPDSLPRKGCLGSLPMNKSLCADPKRMCMLCLCTSAIWARRPQLHKHASISGS